VPTRNLRRTRDEAGYVRVGYDNSSTTSHWSERRSGTVRQDRTAWPRRSSCRHCEHAGVKDVIDRVSVEPVSIFDDGLRLRAERASIATQC